MRIRSRLIDVMTNDRFLDTLWAGTTRPEAVQTRSQLWMRALKGVVDEGSDAIDLAEEVHDRLRRSQICDLCPTVMTPDDAVWQLLPSSKSLVHRSCRALAARS